MKSIVLFRNQVSVQFKPTLFALADVWLLAFTRIFTGVNMYKCEPGWFTVRCSKQPSRKLQDHDLSLDLQMSTTVGFCWLHFLFIWHPRSKDEEEVQVHWFLIFFCWFISVQIQACMCKFLEFWKCLPSNDPGREFSFVTWETTGALLFATNMKLCFCDDFDVGWSTTSALYDLMTSPPAS